MSKSETLDLRQEVDITILFRPNQSAPVKFTLKPKIDGEVVQLDIDYQLTLGSNVYTVGNGLTLVNGDTIIWNKLSTDFPNKGDFASGTLKTVSTNAPQPIEFCVNIEVG